MGHVLNPRKESDGSVKPKADPFTVELLKLKKNGQIKPEDVVEAASDESSPLHSWFEWDDTEAARAYRIWQARVLIRTRVTIIQDSQEPMRIFVNLTSERNEGLGYRELVSVMSNPDMREQLLADALEEMDRFRQKYEQLKELAEVFSAIKKVRARPRSPERARA